MSLRLGKGGQQDPVKHTSLPVCPYHQSRDQLAYTWNIYLWHVCMWSNTGLNGTWLHCLLRNIGLKLFNNAIPSNISFCSIYMTHIIASFSHISHSHSQCPVISFFMGIFLQHEMPQTDHLEDCFVLNQLRCNLIIKAMSTSFMSRKTVGFAQSEKKNTANGRGCLKLNDRIWEKS